MRKKRFQKSSFDFDFNFQIIILNYIKYIYIDYSLKFMKYLYNEKK